MFIQANNSWDRYQEAFKEIEYSWVLEETIEILRH